MHRYYIALLLPFLILLSLHTSFTHAVFTEHVVSLAPREEFFPGKFAFTSNGYISFKISSVSTTTTNDSIPPNASRIGLVLRPLFKRGDGYRFYNTCLLDHPKVTILSTLSDASNSVSKTISIKEPGCYLLALSNCALETHASMTLNTEVYNLDPNGDKSHVSDGLTQIPMVFYYLFGTYAFLFIGWLLLCLLNKPHVKQIHILMALLLVVKGLTLLFAAEHHYYIQVWGVISSLRDSLYWWAHIVTGILFFVVIALIGTGWSWLRPFLNPREKLVLLIGIPLQVLVNISRDMVNDIKHTSTNMEHVFGLMMGVFVIEIACCCLMMLPGFWSMNSLTGSSSKTEGRATPSLKRLKQFWCFLWLVFYYLVLKKFGLWMLHICTLDAYKYWWWNDACREGLTLWLFIVIFFLFRPRRINEYFVLCHDEEEERLALEAIASYV